jgi:hypothetical protein
VQAHNHSTSLRQTTRAEFSLNSRPTLAHHHDSSPTSRSPGVQDSSSGRDPKAMDPWGQEKPSDRPWTSITCLSQHSSSSGNDREDRSRVFRDLDLRELGGPYEAQKHGAKVEDAHPSQIIQNPDLQGLEILYENQEYDTQIMFNEGNGV